MRALLVVAHPCDDSFCHALADAAERGLRAAAHDVDRVDLYAERVRAEMTLAERAAYHTDEPVVDDQVAAHGRLLLSADVVVFVYPTWWGGLPAILKGWLERVMVPGVGFRFDDDSGKVRPGLQNVRRIVGVSTYGSPWWYVKLVNDNGRRIITRAFRMSCGWRTRTRWFPLYAIDLTDDDARRTFAERIERDLAEL
jgi:putative NADPH-quinone reductase